MERLLAALERRFGRFAPAGLTWTLVVAQVVTFVLVTMDPRIRDLMVLDRDAVLRGQVWRLVTYLFLTPAGSGPLWVLLGVYWLHLMGTSLESHWGPFRYALFWVVGMACTTAVAFGTGIRTGNEYLLMSLGLAFATLFPDYELRVLFFIPVKMKWLGLLDALALLYEVATLTGWQRLFPLVAVGNYLLFFTVPLIDAVRGKARVALRSADNGRARREAQAVEAARPVNRRCTICGASDADRAVDIRVCTCEKCGGRPTEFCLAHARNH